VGKSNIAKIAATKCQTTRKIAFDRAERSDNAQCELIAGVGTVLAAGVLQGAFALPMKYARSWNHENVWLVSRHRAQLDSWRADGSALVRRFEPLRRWAYLQWRKGHDTLL